MLDVGKWRKPFSFEKENGFRTFLKENFHTQYSLSKRKYNICVKVYNAKIPVKSRGFLYAFSTEYYLTTKILKDSG